MTPRVLLAWEGGAGRGHVSTLRTIAQALDGVAICDAALNNMRHADELAPWCDLVFPGSAFSIDKGRRRLGGMEPICNWADHLGDLGFCDPQFLIGRMSWWIAAIRARASSVVVADFAPVATLATRVLGIGSAVIGTGYLAPPPGLDVFPQLVPALSTEHYDQSEMLDAVNAALVHFDAAPLSRLSDIYEAHVFLPQTIASLDPYAGQRRVPYLPPVGADMPPSAMGDEIFAYFSTDEKRDEALMEALRRLGPLLRLHMPGISVEQVTTLADAGVKVESVPLPLNAIAARSRMSLNAGQHGSLCMALAMGLPQLAIPRHLEHAYHADKAAGLGCVNVVSRFERDLNAIFAAIMATYENAEMRETARHVADRHAAELCGPLQDLLRQRLAPLVAT